MIGEQMIKISLIKFYTATRPSDLEIKNVPLPDMSVSPAVYGNLKFTHFTFVDSRSQCLIGMPIKRCMKNFFYFSMPTLMRTDYELFCYNLAPTAISTDICRDMTDFEDFSVKSKGSSSSKSNHNVVTGALEVRWNIYFLNGSLMYFPKPWRTLRRLKHFPKSKSAPSTITKKQTVWSGFQSARVWVVLPCAGRTQ